MRAEITKLRAAGAPAGANGATNANASGSTSSAAWSAQSRAAQSHAPQPRAGAANGNAGGWPESTVPGVNGSRWPGDAPAAFPAGGAGGWPADALEAVLMGPGYTEEEAAYVRQRLAALRAQVSAHCSVTFSVAAPRLDLASRDAPP